LVKGRRPFKFLAIVHDVNQDPTWREEWVESALEGILQETEARKLRSVALPLIGTLHGSLEQQRFIELLSKAFKRTSLSQLKRLWLMVRPGTARHIIEMLEFELRK
jgi:O-acetyl-ADP-ribose deacetylase (regulator of RNase III)